MSDLQKKYAELQKKHKLPAFDDLDRSFDITSIEPNSAILREIRKKVEAKLDEAIGLLHAPLQPDATVRDLHECRVFSDKDKAQIFAIYRRLMIQRREASLLSLSSEERKEAAFINACVEEWRAVLPRLQEIMAKLRDSWKKETSVKEELGYLG